MDVKETGPSIKDNDPKNAISVPSTVADDKNSQKLDSTPCENSVQHQDSISSWFSISAFGATLSAKNEKETDDSKSAESCPSWSSAWLRNAKEKTFDTFENMKKDLNEFSDTIQQEACSIASVAANSVKNQAQYLQQHISQQLSPFDDTNPTTKDSTKTEDDPASSAENVETNAESDALFTPSKWMRSFVESVQKLGMEDTTHGEADITEELRYADSPFSRKTNLDQYQLLQIQNDESTYLQEPAQNVDLYREWLTDFRIVEYNGEINILLGNNPKLREIYSHLVPSKVDNHSFWSRYFFKIYLQELDKEIAQRSAKHKDGDSGNGERDETWSMCSSANNDIQDLDDEVTMLDATNNTELNTVDDVTTRQARDELRTPQQGDETDNDDNVDGWEECNDTALASNSQETKSSAKFKNSPSKEKGAKARKPVAKKSFK